MYHSACLIVTQTRTDTGENQPLGLERSRGFNPFTAKGSPFDKKNRLALDRVKSISGSWG